MKNIVIFYSPGAYGSFLTWLIDRFNQQRKMHDPAVIDNPLQSDGSSHSHVSLCKFSNIESIKSWLNSSLATPWGYQIWGGWPINDTTSLDQAINETLDLLGPRDKLIVVSRVTEWETRLCWLNAQTKLDPERLQQMYGNNYEQQLDQLYQTELAQRHFNRVADPRLIEISVHEILEAPASRLLSLLTALEMNVCDANLLESVLVEHRNCQHNLKRM
jgi:hypothetical protein